MRDSDGKIILDKNKAFEFHFSEQDIKDNDEMIKCIAEMKQRGMEKDEIICQILTGGADEL